MTLRVSARRARGGAWAGLARALALGLMAVGCARPEPAPLLEIQSAGPAVLEPGDALSITGAGFVPGQEGTVTFDGTVSRPGQAEQKATITLRARATAPTHLEASRLAPLVQALGPRGTFVGSATVTLGPETTRLAQGVLQGVEFTYHDTQASRGAQERHATEALLEALGIESEGASAEVAGVVLTAVTPGGLAHGANLREGDRIVRAGRHRVHEVEDLVPPPGADHLSLTVWRRGRGSENPEVIVVPLQHRSPAAEEPAATAPPLRSVAWAAIILLLTFFASASPFLHRLLDLILPVDPHGGVARAGNAPGNVTGRRHWLPHLAAGLWATAVAAGSVRFGGFHVVIPLTVALATGRGTLHLLRGQRGLEIPWVDVVGHAGALVASLLVTLVITGELNANGIALNQGRAPWTWNVFTAPALYLLMPALLDLGPGVGRAVPLPRFLGGTERTATAFFLGLVAFGGWAGGTALDCALFGAKVAALSVLLRHLAGTTAGLGARTWVLSVGAMAVTVALETRGLRWDAAVGPLLCGGTLLGILTVAHERLRPSTPEAATPPAFQG